jgi:hypothetical protein
MKMSNNLPRDFVEFYNKLQGNKEPAFYPVANLQCITVNLSTARNNERLEIQGDFIYVDIQSVGEATIGFNNPSQQKIPICPGMNIAGFPIDGVYISHAAQAGFLLNIWYGYGCNFSQNYPYSQTSNSIEFHDTGYDASTPIKTCFNLDYATNVSTQFFSPVINLKGVIFWEIQASHISVPGSNLVIQVASSVPSNIASGVLEQAKESLAFQGATLALSNSFFIVELKRPIRINPNQSVYITSDTNSIAGSGKSHAVYTFL